MDIENINVSSSDVQKAETLKNKGNDLFKSGNYEGAIDYYTKAISINPKDPANYSNRAACYLKLFNYDLCVNDANLAIKYDSKYVKAYRRKAQDILVRETLALLSLLMRMPSVLVQEKEV